LYTDEVLTAHIRHVLATSPFLGEGHRKVWARLRAQGIRTSKPRVLRLMRQADLLAPSRVPRVVGPRVHDGTITTERPNQMWGTDATSTVTVEDGAVTVFIGVDHCTLEGIGIHAAKRATRFEALEPIRQGVRQQFGVVSAGIATGLQVRHDHGSQYMSDDFQAVESGVCPCPGRQRRRRAIHSDAERATLMGAHVPDGGGASPGTP
jgi:transposase InsO family protein